LSQVEHGLGKTPIALASFEIECTLKFGRLPLSRWNKFYLFFHAAFKVG